MMKSPTKRCTEEKMIDKTDQTYPFAMKERRIRDPETLEKWHCDFFDKFAKKTEAI